MSQSAFISRFSASSFSCSSRWRCASASAFLLAGGSLVVELAGIDAGLLVGRVHADGERGERTELLVRDFHILATFAFLHVVVFGPELEEQPE